MEDRTIALLMNYRLQDILLAVFLSFLLHLSLGNSSLTGYTNDESWQRQMINAVGSETKLKVTPSKKPLKIAFCITGQLARLEILSKIKNVLIKNAEVGHIAHAFIYLDDEVENVKQTYWRYNYSSSLYGMYNSHDLKKFIEKSVKHYGYLEHIETFIRFEAPPRDNFEVFFNESIPVSDKTFTGHDGPKDNFEPAATRFQNNMRWMAGLRECARCVMSIFMECTI